MPNSNKKSWTVSNGYNFEIRCLLREDDSDGDKILELAKNKNKNCKKYEGSDVCLLKFENKPDGINACHVEISKMKEKHERHSIYISTVVNIYFGFYGMA